ncbi:PhoH family protein [Ruminococcus sp. 5_1_39BFAA]|uniref:PhoH family protein n=1 Tax=Ruminococcus sp. 5_1_39BFAA TaxID=457412 RepID=UPI00356885A8
MQSITVPFDTIEEIQEVFGVQDIFSKIIENKLTVQINVRGDKVEISGDSFMNINAAVDVIDSMQELAGSGQKINEDTVYRLIDEAGAGELTEIRHAMKDEITLDHKGRPIRCKTIGQRKYLNALKESTVTICMGPAGTGKTYMAVAYAAQLLKDSQIEKIIMSRPAIEAGEERLGFLPGDLAQKVDPYLRPLYDALNDVFGKDRADKYRERGIIEIAPLAYMRGRTLSHAAVIVDESQNATLSTLKMALTRLGEDSKMILTGDVTQIDLPRNSSSGLQHCAEILQPIEGVSVITLNNRDVVRNRIVRDIVKAFEKDEQAREQKDKRVKHSRW